MPTGWTSLKIKFEAKNIDESSLKCLHITGSLSTVLATTERDKKNSRFLNYPVDGHLFNDMIATSCRGGLRPQRSNGGRQSFPNPKILDREKISKSRAPLAIWIETHSHSVAHCIYFCRAEPSWGQKRWSATSSYFFVPNTLRRNNARSREMNSTTLEQVYCKRNSLPYDSNETFLFHFKSILMNNFR